MVEEFGPLCEVQSDKAAVEITSRYTGTVARLHHQPGDMVQVGEGAIPILRAAVCTQTSTVACRSRSQLHHKYGCQAVECFCRCMHGLLQGVAAARLRSLPALLSY